MSKLEQGLTSHLAKDETIEATYSGKSTGLNRPTGNAGPAVVAVTTSGVLVGWMGGLLKNNPIFEHFPFAEIIDVGDGDAPLTGVQGALARKNAEHALGRAMGHTGGAPSLFIRTRRGDVTINFTNKQRGLVREAAVMISDRLG